MGENRVKFVVISAPGEPMLEGRRYYGRTKDVSVDGMRFCVCAQLPLASVIKMDVHLDHAQQDCFMHMGRLAWEQEFADGGSLGRWVGVEIMQHLGSREDTARWLAMTTAHCVEIPVC